MRSCKCSLKFSIRYYHKNVLSSTENLCFDVCIFQLPKGTLQKLGIGKDLARQSSYVGDHYQWIVTKTCLVRAISKEKLKQAVLVSCCDYYMERHALKLC